MILTETIFWGLASASTWCALKRIMDHNESANDETTGAESTDTTQATSTGTSGNAPPDKKQKEKQTEEIQILQARWGLSSGDVDVTKKVQAMVVKEGTRDVLRIPASFDFNKEFGDPAWFQRKKLRIVALVGGKPYVDVVHEIRSKDLVVYGSSQDVVNQTGGFDLDEEEITPRHSANEEGSGSAEESEEHPCHPVMTRIITTFSAVKKSHGDKPFSEIELEDFLVACDAVSDMVSLFGTSFLPVRANITDNIQKIQACMKKAQAAGAEHHNKIGPLINAEKAAGKHKKDGTVCLSALWLKRALDFMVVFLECLSANDSTDKAAQTAYKTALGPWHGWILSTTCTTAMRMVPGRPQLVQILFPGGLNGAKEEDVIRKSLTHLLSSGLSPIVGKMDKWYSDQGLDFTDKV